MRDSSRQLGRVAGRAVADPVGLTAVMIGLLAAPLIGAWWPVLLAVVLYGVVVGRRLSSPAFWARTLGPDPGPTRLPDPMRVSDPELRSLLCGLSTGREELARVLAEAPANVRVWAGSALPAVDDLEAHAARLILRGDALSRYLRRARRELLGSEIARLEGLVGETHDEVTQREYRQVLAARQLQRDALDELVRAQERIQASLMRLLAIVEALPSRIVRLHVIESESRDALSGELDHQLARIDGELGTCEETLRLLDAEVAE